MPAPANHPEHPQLEVRGARSSSVIVQRVPPGAIDAFMDWQRGITREASGFPGYVTTELYPAPEANAEWVALLHFADRATLERWLESPQRAAWLAKRPAEMPAFRIKVLPAGLGDWFAGLNDAAPATWKAALAVLLALYPTAMLLQLFLAPHLTGLSKAWAVLIGNAAGVALLQWVVMPLLSRILRPWLRGRGRSASLLGALTILTVLVLLAWGFDGLTG